jgi:hypothetical protein
MTMQVDEQARRSSAGRRPAGNRLLRSYERHCASPLEQTATVMVLGHTKQEMPVPSSLQYPVQRHRDLQRKWNRLLQRNAGSKEDRASGALTGFRVPAPFTRPTASLASSKR